MSGKYGSLVKDENEFEYFVSEVLPPLDNNSEQAYFISLSARQKHLTPDERGFYNLGRTEMFARTLGYGDWEFTMQKLASHLTYKRTKNGLEFPEKSLVVYVNVNPSDLLLASLRFAEGVQKVATEVITANRNGKRANTKNMAKADRLLMNYIQKSPSRTVYLDVDVDTKEPQDTQLLTAKLDAYGVEYHVLKTAGGFHVMVNRASMESTPLRKSFHQTIKQVDARLKPLGGECKFNTNKMVPVPGTLQYGVLVTNVRK